MKLKTVIILVEAGLYLAGSIVYFCGAKKFEAKKAKEAKVKDAKEKARQEPIYTEFVNEVAV